jgi:integrase
MAQKILSKFSRNDIRYWEQRVYQPAFRDDDGNAKMNGNYHVKIQAHRERRGVSLHATSVRSAAKAARDLDALVRLEGWEKGLQLFRGEAPVPKITLTLGDYLAEVAACGVISPRTLRTYTTKVRTIAASISKPKMPEMPDKACSNGKSGKPKSTKTFNKFDYFNGGAAVWQRLVDATPLHLLNTENILSWRKECLKLHEQNPRRLASATKTVNSCIRAGKAIFAAKVRDKLPHVLLPDPVPFVTLDLLKEKKRRYRSQIASPEELLIAGTDELGMATTESEFLAVWKKSGGSGLAPAPTPAERIRAELSAFRKKEAFKVLVLGLCAGLRRGEIDGLIWSQVDITNSCLWMETTEVHDLKADSEGRIPLDRHVLELLKNWQSHAKDQFVLLGGESKIGSDKMQYRANRVHKELIKWLKSKGLTSRMAIHTLRKEFGSIICAQAGIHAASRLLRHANITQTADVYADHRNSVTAGLGGSLLNKKQDESPAKNQDQ